MASSNIRYGAGVSREIGMDLQNLGAQNVCLMTDRNLSVLPPVKAVLESLAKNGVQYKVYDNVRVEPTDTSFKEAIAFAKNGSFDVYVAVGGGSVIDTCKAANLYASHPDADFLDFVNAPIGKGKPVTGAVRPLIAVPTTAGTGSETTGVAIFDFESLKAKTGMPAEPSDRHWASWTRYTLSMPERVAANSGFDVLCHALESYTALPYNQRSPCPSNPINRPAYQGSNPISDVWSRHALNVVAKFMKRHGMSYPIAGNVKTHSAKGYSVEHPLVPHGLSVVLTSPAVFNFTAPMCPERHLEAAEILGADIRQVKREDAGAVLADTLRHFLFDLAVEDGLGAVGYSTDDIPALVKGTIPQFYLCSGRSYSEAAEDKQQEAAGTMGPRRDRDPRLILMTPQSPAPRPDQVQEEELPPTFPTILWRTAPSTPPSSWTHPLTRNQNYSQLSSPGPDNFQDLDTRTTWSKLFRTKRSNPGSL
ncbi:Hydroxyacid-oxoacid transhydrogenase, mitochondrial [Larimichthys crocea]|uniref:Hydroxyacid-oxoacid transhydrogenase, mitochondrial n=1 Tax=Larimichthys crocea TaxID=215358 RepID=A0A6G0HDX8_LARCR|nr:Hydroxyacid-oxoacid transhydrogenase, mitochondrial [Larimichthys crocea]